MIDTNRGAGARGNRTAATGDNTKTYVIVGAVVVVVILAVAAVVLTGGKSNGSEMKEGTGVYAADRAEREQAPVEVVGTSLPAMPDSGGTGFVPADADPAVGKTSPRLKGMSFDGTPVVIDAADGRAKVIMFVAHWCHVCQNEVPR